MKSTWKCITLATVNDGVWRVSCLKGREDQRLLSLYSNVQCIFYQHSFLLFHAHQRTWQYITLPLYSLLAATFSSQWLLATLSVLSSAVPSLKISHFSSNLAPTELTFNTGRPASLVISNLLLVLLLVAKEDLASGKRTLLWSCMSFLSLFDIVVCTAPTF